MRQRILDLIEILSSLRQRIDPTSDQLADDLVRVRNEISHEMAANRGVNPTTTADSYLRGGSVHRFDELVMRWLQYGDSTALLAGLQHMSGADESEVAVLREVLQTEGMATGIAAADFSFPEEVAQSTGLLEGAARTVLVNAYERSQEARRLCIAAHGTNCAACGMNFGAVYGPSAEGYIHVHHLKMLSEVRESHAVDPVVDMRPVCPNCHAVIHLDGECRTINDVRRLLGKLPSPEC